MDGSPRRGGDMKFNRHSIIGTMRTVKMLLNWSYTQNSPYKGVKHANVFVAGVAKAHAAFKRGLSS